MLAPFEERLLSAPQVCARLGISDMSLWRWAHQAELGFPKPIRINKRRFYRLSEIIEFEARQHALSNDDKSGPPKLAPKAPKSGWTSG